MTALYIISGIILFFALLAHINISFILSYNNRENHDAGLILKILFLKFDLLKEKTEKPAKVKKTPKKTKKTTGKVQSAPDEALGKPKTDIAGLIKLILVILKSTASRFKKKLKTRAVRLVISVGTEDAYKTSQVFAAVNNGAAFLLEFIDNNLNCRFKEVRITPDFTSHRTVADISVKLLLPLKSILAVAFGAAFKFVMYKLKSKEKPAV